MTGQMKEFCDHMAYRWISHRPVDMHRKIGVAISTAAGGGAENVTKELSRQLLWWSVGSIHSIAFSVRADNWDAVKPSRKKKVERKVARLAERINKTSTHAGLSVRFSIRPFAQKRKSLGPASRWQAAQDLHFPGFSFPRVAAFLPVQTGCGRKTASSNTLTAPA